MSTNRDRVEYPRYVTTLVTQTRGTVVGARGQHPEEVVMATYGDPAGLRHYGKDGIEYLVVLPPEERPVTADMMFGMHDRVRVPTAFVTTQRVIDYVFTMTQEPVR